jgi:predicted nucleic acid-binding protein
MADDQLLREIADRLRRTESRLVQLGHFVGVELRARRRVDVRADHRDVDIDALDVSISRIYAELANKGIKSGEVPVYLGDRLVATLYP